MTAIEYKSYRSKLEIIATILRVVAHNTSYNGNTKEYRGVPKTRVMYAAYLSHTQLNSYIKFLLQKDLIDLVKVNEQIRPHKGMKRKVRSSIEVCITEKGKKFIENADKTFNLIDIDTTIKEIE